MSKIHYVKIAPQYFLEVQSGNKKFEVRYNDRDYRVGDFLLLCEFYNGRYTGKREVRKITYILDDVNYCKQGFVIMSIAPCDTGACSCEWSIDDVIDGFERCFFHEHLEGSDPCDDCPFLEECSDGDPFLIEKVTLSLLKYLKNEGQRFL